LTQQHPDNLVYCLEQLNLLMKLKKNIEAETYQRNLIESIRSSNKINGSQKDHFISQIGALIKTGVKE